MSEKDCLCTPESVEAPEYPIIPQTKPVTLTKQNNPNQTTNQQTDTLPQTTETQNLQQTNNQNEQHTSNNLNHQQLTNNQNQQQPNNQNQQPQTNNQNKQQPTNNQNQQQTPNNQNQHHQQTNNQTRQQTTNNLNHQQAEDREDRESKSMQERINQRPNGYSSSINAIDTDTERLMSHSDTMTTILSADSTIPEEGTDPLIMNGEDDRTVLPTDGSRTYRTYGIRWVILFLFVAYSMSNAFQWIQYSIITNIIVRYYGVEAGTVDWLSMVYMISYIPLIFPASWYLEKYGLRKAVLIGSFGTMLGAWVKTISVSPDRFWVTCIGQLITACSQIFILGIPPRLAAVWFGYDQVSTACAIGVFGNQLGCALGFLLPPVLVPNSQDLADITRGLYTMFFGMAGLCTLLFILVVFVFKEKPPTPPSAAAQSASEEQGTYLQGVMRLISNRNYVLLLLSYGMNVGVFYGIGTLLNQTVLAYFPDETQNAGRIGLLIVLAGMVGSVVCGLILDKTAKFKLVTLSVYVSAFVFMIVYTFILEVRILGLVFVMAAALGFFMTGYLPVGFEFAAELTFPEPEGTSSGLLNASAQFFGIFCTLAGSQMMAWYNDRAVNLVFCSVLFVGAIMTALIREELRRQDARRAPVHENGVTHIDIPQRV